MKQTVLKIAVLGFAILASFVMFMNRSDAQGSRKQNNGATPARSLSPQGKTVEQVEKNIKVLNGMPDSQLIPAMKFMAVSLGVRCDFCHVEKNGQLDAAADDKEEKRMARAMIKMVLDINKTYAQGNPEVSCYTCHRGRTSPQAFPTLPLPPQPSPVAAAGASGDPGTAMQASPALPSADAILNKYIGVIGGQAATDRIKSCVIKGTVAYSNGLTGTYETVQVAPDKGYESIVTQRGGRERAVNGARGWEKNFYGMNDLAGQQTADVKLSLQLFINLKLKDQYASLQVSGMDRIGDRDVYVVSATRTDRKRERLYFDAENGLLLRRITNMQTMISIIPEQTDFEDYREVEGVKFPFTVRVSSVDTGTPIITRKFEEVKLNVTVDAPKFNKPTSP